MKVILAMMMCGACPEQWDFYDNDTGEQIAYLRLRGGNFRVDVPKCRGETIYRAVIEDEAGMFSHGERRHYLNEAAKAVAKHYKWDDKVR